MQPIIPTTSKIIVVISLALAMQHSCVQAQSLFNNRATSGQSQSSINSSTGSLFSGNAGFPRAANAGEGQAAGGTFVGRSSQGFVGRGATGQSSAAGSESGNARRRTAITPRGGSAATEGDQPRAPAERQADGSPGRARRTTIVPRHRIAFVFSARQPIAISARLQTQLANLATRNPDFARIEVHVDEHGRVKLHGTVPSENTRKLAAILVGLEPGVREVHNELTVATDGE